MALDRKIAKRNLALVGRKVVLTRDVLTKAGVVHKAGSEWECYYSHMGRFSVSRPVEDNGSGGNCEIITGLSYHSLREP